MEGKTKAIILLVIFVLLLFLGNALAITNDTDASESKSQSAMEISDGIANRLLAGVMGLVDIVISAAVYGTLGLGIIIGTGLLVFIVGFVALLALYYGLPPFLGFINNRLKRINEPEESSALSET
jgi:hypothetical protein